MARTAEAYDLLIEDPVSPLEPVGLMLARNPGRSGRPSPLQLEEVLEAEDLGVVNPPKPVPVVWDSWLGGGAVSKPMPNVANTYQKSANACTRYGVISPAGGLHEVTLSHLPKVVPKINHLVDFKGQLVILTNDNQPLLIQPGEEVPIIATTLQAGTFCEDAAVFGGNLYVCGGNTDITRYTPEGAWQQAAVGGVLARSRLARVNWTRQGIPRWRLISTHPNGSAVLYTTGDDPLNPAHWGPTLTLEAAWPAQDLVATRKHCYGIGPGGVFDITENGETPTITGETFSQNYDPSNGASGVVYDGALYICCATGTYRVSLTGEIQDVLEDVSIGHLQPAEIDAGGRPRWMGVVDGWLCQVLYIDSTQTSELWFGMRRERMGQAVPWPMIWHGSECNIVGQDVTAACVVSRGGKSRRLYFGTIDAVTGQTRLFYQTLPKYGSPVQDYLFGADVDRMDYAPTWSIVFTELTLGDPSTWKNPYRWHTLSRFLGGPNQLSISVAPRGADADYVLQGSATSDDAEVGSVEVRSKGLTVKIDGTNQETVPAVLESLRGSFVVTADETATVMLEVVFGRGVPLLNGAEDPQDADVTFGRLLELTAHPRLEATRWNGERVGVRIEQGLRRRWREDALGEDWVDGAVLVLSVLDRVMHHDVGDLHDSGWTHGD